jgi:uncharacterized RDD family membrane protein YckC
MLHPNQEKLDCFVRVITPENVEFEYALAGPFQRLPAFLFDIFVRFLVMFALLIVAGFTTSFVPMGDMLSSVMLLLAFFALDWFYGIYFETRFSGRTLGKMLFRLRVISVDGRPINAEQAALRNILRFADLYLSPLIGLTSMVLTKRLQRLGDLAAGTMVIADRVKRSPWDIQPEDARAFGLAELIPPNFVASQSLALTIGMYMENRQRLPASRRLDVARHLAGPLLRHFELLPDTSPDLLLCALYVRIFMSDEQQQKGVAQLRATIPGLPTLLRRAIPSRPSFLNPDTGAVEPGGLAPQAVATTLVTNVESLPDSKLPEVGKIDSAKPPRSHEGRSESEFFGGGMPADVPPDHSEGN